ncbi:MAG: group II intron reverse transcriptase/maturase [Nostoc sp.]|uniref:group II intron reverse transcriptase/maturase n=1 Tax=Nostoc sp. TaxID=1180 RepID=UPI002FF7F92F
MTNTSLKTTVEWNQTNWRKLERVVFKLQKRIYKASNRGDVKAVRRLQKMLMKSWSGKMLAVRRVTQDNQGKNTAGIDGVKSLTPNQRLKLVKILRFNEKVKPTRRLWIPKPGSNEKRPLGIPTIDDRILQTLVKLALEPEWEAKFEPNSYGFRPGRSCHDAVDAIFKAIKQKAKFVLDADIAKCFDKINHETLLRKLNTFPTLRRQIKVWLKAGFMEDLQLFPTPEGTPQGGVISPLLANIALHGMEERVKQYAETLKGHKQNNRKSLSLIRYADDFVVIHENILVVQRCQEIISEWLKDMGLELKPSKTRLTHTLNKYGSEEPGFNFLGFNIRQFPAGKYKSGKSTNGDSLLFKTIITPSKAKQKVHYKRISEVIEAHKSAPQSALISHLNPIIRGWANYYSTVVSKEAYTDLDNLMYLKLRAWSKRRHPNKSGVWITSKYWQEIRNRNWAFATEGKPSLELLEHKKTPIVRHTKVKGESSPFDGNLIYWATRKGNNPEMPIKTSKLLKQQKGKCNHCGLFFREDDVLEVDHIIPKSQGGKDDYKNIQLLHRHCHDTKTASNGSKGIKAVINKNGESDCNSVKPSPKVVRGTHNKSQVIEEPDDAKVSRPVLKTSGTCESLA